tara:strand:+ start:324 stop:587 length:264 start_codon:yes stop_codon:yes gene_type:complete
MSRKQRHIKSQSNINYEEPYVIIKRPTNATFIPKETMERDEEKTSVRQTCKTVYAQSRLAENKKTKGQAETACAVEVMESETVGLPA